MNIRILARRGVPEVLGFLSKGESVTTKELVEKTSIGKMTLPIIRKEGLVEVSVERVPIRERPVKVRRAFYRLTEKGRKMLELYTTLSEGGDMDLLRVTPKQIKCLTPLEGGWKRLGDVPEEARGGVSHLVDRGLVEKKVSEEEETRKVYGARRLYTITEKGLKIYKAYKTIKASGSGF